MTPKEKFGYSLFQRTKDLAPLGNKGKGIPFLTNHSKRKGHFEWTRHMIQWEFAELYFGLETPDDEYR